MKTMTVREKKLVPREVLFNNQSTYYKLPDEKISVCT